MNNSSNPPSSKETIKAAGAVLNMLPQLGALVVGFSALTYVSGLREASFYYQELGAPWVVPLLTVSQIMQTSIWLFGILTIFSLLSFYSLVHGYASQKDFRRGSIIFLIISGICALIPVFLGDRLSNFAINLLEVSVSFSWVISAGFTIGELICCLALDEFKWGGYHLFLLLFVILYLGLWQAPSNMGVARAKQAGDLSDTPLPKVSLSSPNQTGDWRLVSPLGDKLFLVSLSEDRKDRRFKMISIDAAEVIFAPHSK